MTESTAVTGAATASDPGREDDPAALSIGDAARIDDALRRWDWSRSNEPAGPMALLDLVRERFPGPPLQQTDLLLIQHHLATTVPLVRAFTDDGLAVGDIWHADIPYSTNRGVNELLRTSLGHEDRTTPRMNDPLADYTVTQLLRVGMLLIALADRRRRRDGDHNGGPQAGAADEHGARGLLVLDDGAYFLRAVLALRTAGHPAWKDLAGAAVVEQTTRGHRFLATHAGEIRDLGLRVVSVARTTTKVGFEGPFIGGAVSRAVTQRAAALDVAPRRIAIIGFGVVGRATAVELRRALPEAELVIVESLEDNRDNARLAMRGAQVVGAVADSDGYDLVVGCTGRNSFTVADRTTLADGALLASGSSAALEFDRAGFIELADAFDDDDVELLDRDETRNAGIHANLRMSFEGGKRATFLNAGFPVNFDGREECLPVQMIAPTRCLMYAAAGQALEQPTPGLDVLHPKRDAWILSQALDQL